MDSKINIAKILKDKPRGTKLYSTVHGKCSFEGVTDEIFKINFCTSKFGLTQTGECTLIKFGNMFDGGECIVFPSREMRDWSKFAWMKGDVLVNDDKDVHIIFEAFENNTYTRFKGKHYLWKEGNEEDYAKEETYMLTSRFEKVNDDAVKCYINAIEERLGGKLNRESLEVEKAQPEFKDGDIVFVESHMLGINTSSMITAIFRKEKGNDKYKFSPALCESNVHDTYLRESPVVLSPSDIKTFRLATDSEKQQLFDALAKYGKAWDAEKKAIVDLKPKVGLKPFSKVLVRESDCHPWRCEIYSHYNIKKDTSFNFVCVGGIYKYCILYEGNEHLLGTTKDMGD